MTSTCGWQVRQRAEASGRRPCTHPKTEPRTAARVPGTLKSCLKVVKAALAPQGKTSSAFALMGRFVSTFSQCPEALEALN